MKNIAVIAHIDAGKTTVCERLLYFSHSIPEFGNIEEGLTTLDFLEEERKRGITIESGTISLNWKQEKLGLIDTPGHIDFGIEVDLSLKAVENALIIVSATGGIESQTLDVLEKVNQQKLPSICFINKLDHIILNLEEILFDLEETLERKLFTMSLPIYKRGQLKGVIDVMNQKAFYCNIKNPREMIMGSIPLEMKKHSQEAFQKLIDIASLYNDQVADLFLTKQEFNIKEILKGLVLASISQNYMPIYMGSAFQNVGIRQLLNGLIWFTPQYQEKSNEDLGFVCKVQIDKKKKRYWVKLNKDFSLPYANFSNLFEIKAQEFESIRWAQAGSIIGVELKDKELFLNSVLTSKGVIQVQEEKEKIVPLLESTLEIEKEEDEELVKENLQYLSQIYPSIQVRFNQNNGQWIVSTLGELQLQVFYERLLKMTQVRITLREIKPIYYERYQLNSSYIQKNQISLYSQNLEIEYKISPHQSRVFISEVELNCSCLKAVESAFSSFVKTPILNYGELIGFSITLLNVKYSGNKLLPTLLYKALYDGLNLYFLSNQFKLEQPFVRLQVLTPIVYCGVVIQNLEKQHAVIEFLENIDASTKIVAQISLKAVLDYTTTIRSLTKGQGKHLIEYLCYR